MASALLAGRGRDTVASVLEEHAARRPDAAFVVFERSPGDLDEVSWAEINRRAEATAELLGDLGVSALRSPTTS